MSQSKKMHEVATPAATATTYATADPLLQSKTHPHHNCPNTHKSNQTISVRRIPHLSFLFFFSKPHLVAISQTLKPSSHAVTDRHARIHSRQQQHCHVSFRKRSHHRNINSPNAPAAASHSKGPFPTKPSFHLHALNAPGNAATAFLATVVHKPQRLAKIAAATQPCDEDDAENTTHRRSHSTVRSLPLNQVACSQYCTDFDDS